MPLVLRVPLSITIRACIQSSFVHLLFYIHFILFMCFACVCVCVCVCVFIYICTMCLVSMEIRREQCCTGPLELELEMVCGPPRGCWELNLYPLQEQQVLLNHWVISPYPHFLNLRAPFLAISSALFSRSLRAESAIGNSEPSSLDGLGDRCIWW